VSFLLDTNVISELAKRRPSAAVMDWLQTVESVDLFLSVITLGEIRKGIERKRKADGLAADALEAWFATLVLRYRSRILSFDEESADRWGRIMAINPNLPVEDGQLAATALRHDLILVTRNLRHVEMTGVRLFNPF
jgi:toxin FitB